MKTPTIIAVVSGLVCLASVVAISMVNSDTPSTPCASVFASTTQVHVAARDAKLDKYASTTKDIWGRSTDGGQQTIYTENKEVVVIRETLYGETWQSETSFYFDRNQVFFIRNSHTKYRKPYSEDPTLSGAITQIRTYYLDGNESLCAWYQDDILQSDDATQSNSDVRDWVQEMVSAVKAEVNSAPNSVASSTTEKITKTDNGIEYPACATPVLRSQIVARLREIDGRLGTYTASSETRQLADLNQVHVRTTYTDAGNKVFIHDQYLGDAGMTDIYYHLYDEKVFYILKYTTGYEQPLSVDPSGKIRVVHNREFYFDNNQVLCFWHLGGALQSNDPATLDSAKLMIASLKD